jgi:HK97 family phage portal protein
MSALLRGLFEKKVVDATPLLLRGLGGSSKTGISVTEMTALRVAAVWACCKVMCEDIGKVPLKLMQEKDDESKTVAVNHPLHRVLNRRPNEWQTSTEWRETMMLHALLSKGGHSFINRDKSTGEVLELIPLLPHRICAKQDKNWTLTYELETDGSKMEIPRSDVHTIRGLSWNGYSALQLIQQGKEAIALALATEESQARLHGQGVRPGGNLTTAAKLSDAEVDRLKAEFAANYGGVENSFKTILLDNGIKFEPWAMTGVDAQHLETRRHQIEEIARLFRVFPAMIGYSDKASTYASAEAFFIAHVVHTLMPWFNRWEQAMCRDLLSESDLKRGFYPKFFVQGLLRGDSAARSAFYESAVSKACWMTRNEARKLEDMNPLPGLDELLVPMNLQGAQEKPDDDGADNNQARALNDLENRFRVELAQARADLNTRFAREELARKTG